MRSMNEQPDVKALQQAYGQRAFSVFAVSHQRKLPGERVVYSTIHSAFIIPLQGSARLCFGEDTCLRGCPGVVLHGCPHKRLTFEVYGNIPFEHVNIYYSAGLNGGSDPGSWMDRPYAFEVEGYTEICDRVLRLEALGAHPSLENRLNQIIGATNLVRTLFEPSKNRQIDARMVKVKSYVEKYFARPLTLSQLAAMSHLSKNRFSACFLKAYGMRPMSFLIAKRLECAQELLQTNMLIKDIAQAVGYDDPLYFSRLFKKHYGCSPQAARLYSPL